jgi:hypothetical protein
LNPTSTKASNVASNSALRVAAVRSAWVRRDRIDDTDLLCSYKNK